MLALPQKVLVMWKSRTTQPNVLAPFRDHYDSKMQPKNLIFNMLALPHVVLVM